MRFTLDPRSWRSDGSEQSFLHESETCPRRAAEPIRIETTAAVVSIRCSRSPVGGAGYGQCLGTDGRKRALRRPTGVRGPLGRALARVEQAIHASGPRAREPAWASRCPRRVVTGRPRPCRSVSVAGPGRRWVAEARRCQRSARDGQASRACRADQGPASTALRVEDSPTRWPSEASEPITGSPGRTRRENRRAPPQ